MHDETRTKLHQLIDALPSRLLDSLLGLLEGFAPQETLEALGWTRTPRGPREDWGSHPGAPRWRSPFTCTPRTRMP
jgi:hypothetical protein